MATALTASALVGYRDPERSLRTPPPPVSAAHGGSYTRSMRAVRGILGTLLAGILFGYVAAAFGGMLFQETGVFGSGESGAAREYMVSLLGRDPDALLAVAPQRDVASRALVFQGAQEGKGQAVPVSLTYIGGGSQGRMNVQIYTVEWRIASGRTRLIPYAVTLIDGRVVRHE